MTTALVYITWLAGIAFSIYLITQTGGRGLPPSARWARTRAIVWGFIPLFGIEIVCQLYFYAKVRRALASEAQLDQVPKSFTPPPPTDSQYEDGASRPASQSQQKFNPFL
jgi:hypothetical protein